MDKVLVPAYISRTFSLEAGHILSILGPNGIGKTTLLKCMIGLLSWSSGHSLLNGQYIQQLKAKEIWNTISYIPQTHGFSFSYTGLEMVMMGRSSHLSLFEQPGTKEIEMAEAMMERLESRILPRRIVTA
ncbi:ABC transporter ATP-binding protein [Anthropogastromicrobium sp.]|uniref:ABC transporter ATP-binding protein n=1 Tax=Anthropogastromicrobium sp. TaxID=2981649 RepID=UPI00307B8FFC